MIIRYFIASVLAISVIAPSGVHAQDAMPQNRAQSALQNECAQLLAGRFDLYAAALDEAFVDISSKGERISKASLVARVKMMQGVMKLSTCKETVSTASVVDGKIVASARQEITGSLLTNKGWEPMTLSGESLDTFVERDGVLLEVRSVDKNSTLTVAGKIVSGN